MIDPNKIHIQSNRLYQSEELRKSSGLSGGMIVRQAEIEPPPTTTRQKTGFKGKIDKLVQSFKKNRENIPREVSHQTLANRLSHKNEETGKNDKPFDATSLSRPDLLTAGYVTMRKQAEGTNENNIEAFERDATDSVLVRREFCKDKEIIVLGKELVGIARKQDFAIDGSAFSRLREKESRKLNKGESKPLTEEQVQKVATRMRDQIDTCMSLLFGIPDDEKSTKKAASRYPQGLCDLLKIQFVAIDQCDAPREIKDQMKLHVARDTLTLRSVNSILGDIGGKTQLTDKQKGSSILQLSKAIQALVNGSGLSSFNLSPELQHHSEEMKDIWNRQFINFVNAIVARADEETVITHAHHGETVRELMN